VSFFRSTPTVFVYSRNGGMTQNANGIAGKHNFSSVGRSTPSESPSPPKEPPPKVLTAVFSGLTK
jgi:hypothetical protein